MFGVGVGEGVGEGDGVGDGVGTAVGVNALLARSLGEKDTEKVNKVAENAVFLILVSYLLFLIIGLFFAEPFFRSQTDIEEIIVYGKQYLTICCCLSFGIFTQLMFERMLQATGKTIYTMYTQGIGAIINIALDPVLIFGLFGLPKMGISGAAAATVIGQMIAGILAVVLNHTKNKEVQIDLHHFYCNAGDRFRDELRYEPYPDRVFLHGNRSVRRLL